MIFEVERYIFRFLRFLRFLPDEVRNGASKLIQAYPENGEKDFEDELVQFSELLKINLADIVSESQQDL